MNAVIPQKLDIAVGNAASVSALLIHPPNAHACFVFAHGAGAGMTHPFMEAAAQGLAERAVATLRYQFLYMEKGSKRPDPPAVAQAAVRAAVAEAGRSCAGLRLIAGGKSFGGRMTSQAQASAPLDGVDGLAFLGFPLHPAGKPSSDRAKHLSDIRIPMLFMQGSRDSLAEVSLLQPVVKSLGPSASLHLVEGGRSFLSRAGAFGTQRPRGPGRNSRCVGRLDRCDLTALPTLPKCRIGYAGHNNRQDQMRGRVNACQSSPVGARSTGRCDGHAEPAGGQQCL